MANPLQRYQFRKDRVRKKILGTSERPRLAIYRSSKYIYAQAIDDSIGKTLVAASSLNAKAKEVKSACNIASAQKVGQQIAKSLLEKNIKKVVFDRGGRIYHGCVKAVADSARHCGLEF